jgi:NTP pyrophosphatase (non-canonical NTP hydrolase)
MRLNTLMNHSHSMAKKKGWWDSERSPLEIHMLIVSEIAEATEAARTDPSPFYFVATGKPGDPQKPEGEAVELVDAIIRIADYFGKKGWDLEEVVKAKLTYNATRPHRHGGKKF